MARLRGRRSGRSADVARTDEGGLLLTDQHGETIHVVPPDVAEALNLPNKEERNQALAALRDEIVYRFEETYPDNLGDVKEVVRSVEKKTMRQQILDMMLTLSAMLGLHDKGAALIAGIERDLNALRNITRRLPRRPPSTV